MFHIFLTNFTAGGHFHCNLLLAACLGGGEERACIRRCLLPVSTHHHRGFLSNNVSGDASLGKVSLSRTSCLTCDTDVFNFDRVCVCSVSGAVLLIIGLYGILWGKSNEVKRAATNLEAQNEEVKMEGKLQASEETEMEVISCH